MDIEQKLGDAIGRTTEVYEAMEARKGAMYALKVKTFSDFTRIAAFATPKEVFTELTRNLLTCLGIGPDETNEFLYNVDALNKAQKVNHT